MSVADPAPGLERLLRRDRGIVIAGLAVAIAAAWLYVLAGAGLDMTGGEMSGASAWTPGYFLLMLAMWWAMMVAMMLPSAAPMILLFATINRRNRALGHAVAPTAAFAASYVIVWGVFSLAAVLAQRELQALALLSPAMASTSAGLGAGLLIGAGVYQLTPLKQACLRHCRTPIHFMARRWRNGSGGALRMGLEHGGFCLGCCWVLMVLLFYGGVMDLRWIAGLALYVLVEKLAPAGHWIGRLGGVALIGWGAAVALGQLGGV